MRAAAVSTLTLALLLTACTADEPSPERSATTTTTSETPSNAAPRAGAPLAPSASEESQPAEPAQPAEPVVLTSTRGRHREARLSIPALGLSGIRVVPYVGTPDDGPGTVIQDRAFAASPYGGGGLVGPGGIGNYLITGHRTSSTAPFRYLPSVRVGARVVVVTGSHRLVYEIVGTRRTSFRSERSLREQSAAVPGHPGQLPTRAMITLSTCATPEDHAAGNFWSDEFHNPEHRIEKIGVLRSVVRV
jgi:sortase A